MKKLEIKFLSFYSCLNNLKGRTAITFHQNGDIDAVCSALVLKSIIKSSSIRSPGKLDAGAKKLLEDLGFGMLEFKDEKELLQFDNLIFVDMSNPSQIGDWKSILDSFKGNVFVIDHHDSYPRIQKSKQLILNNYSSCAEIIFEIYNCSKKKLKNWQAVMICCAILSDTYYFQSANNHSLKTFSNLLESFDLDFQYLLDLCKKQPDISQKLKTMQSIKDCKIIKTKNYVYSYSLVDSYDLSCATAMVSCGADFAVACNSSHGRLSAVCSKILVKKGMNVGVFLSEISKNFGSAGGHNEVGGMSFEPKNSIKIINRINKKINNLFKKLER